MKIEELKHKHWTVNPKYSESGNILDYTNVDKHLQLSIQFAIEILKELQQFGDDKNYNEAAWSNLFYFKIKELKKYL